jgi:hypothetical protein
MEELVVPAEFAPVLGAEVEALAESALAGGARVVADGV